jgi:hypothetical protein
MSHSYRATFNFLLFFSFCIIALYLVGSINTQAATLNVNTTIDELDFTSNTTCSWREAAISITKGADFGGCAGGNYSAALDDAINLPSGNYILTQTNPFPAVPGASVLIGNYYPTNILGGFNATGSSQDGKLTVNGDPNGSTVIIQSVPTLNNLMISDFDITLNNITFRGGLNGIKYKIYLDSHLSLIP